MFCIWLKKPNNLSKRPYILYLHTEYSGAYELYPSSYGADEDDYWLYCSSYFDYIQAGVCNKTSFVSSDSNSSHTTQLSCKNAGCVTWCTWSESGYFSNDDILQDYYHINDRIGNTDADWYRYSKMGYPPADCTLKSLYYDPVQKYSNPMYISPTSKTLYSNASGTGEHNTFTITVYSAQGSVSYSSSNSNVASVNSRGVVTYVSAGTCTITVTAAGNDNYEPGSVTCSVTCVEYATYKVTFYSNGGNFSESWGVSASTLAVEKEVQYMSLDWKSVNKAEKEGFYFIGWYTKYNGGEQVYGGDGLYCNSKYFDNYGRWIYKGNVNLYAQYNNIKYYIQFNPNCNDYIGVMNTITCHYDEVKILSKNAFTRPNYGFLYWTLDKDGTGITYKDEKPVTNLTNENEKTIILYAQWEDIYSEKGYKEFGLMYEYNKMSVNSIKTSIENNNVEFYKDDNEEQYKVKIIDPDSVDTLDIFTVTPKMEDNKNIISSVDIAVKSDVNDLNLKIINRYSGYYNPIFKDILFYDNYENNQFSHTSFDDEYKDNYGMFGMINNMWFHKVNNEKTNIIGTKESKYPLTGEYALDFKDYNIFSTTWDKNYYTKQTDISNKESCSSMESMKEGLCMFGGKYLNVPEYIELECFDNGTWDGEWNDEWVSNYVGCPGEVMFKEVNNNSVDFYFFIHKRLVRFFCEKLKDEFGQYVNPEYSYGKKNSIDDVIEEYVSKNILKLYELKKIRTFVKRIKKGITNGIIENEYDANLKDDVKTLKKNGFKEINNVFMSKKSIDDFDRQLTYNLRNGEQEYFGFQIVIKKI